VPLGGARARRCRFRGKLQGARAPLRGFKGQGEKGQVALLKVLDKAPEAALFRPQTGYYDDIVAQAAALLESLAIIHPFVDGNKRIAFTAADVFLRINGWSLHRAPMQIHTEMIQMLESGPFDIAHLDPWLRGFAEPSV